MSEGKDKEKWGKKTPQALPERRKRVVFDLGVTDTRATPTRVKTAKRRTAQSAAWLERQLYDPYVAKARAEGWRARSAFKLLELDEKFHIIPKGGRVLDLGAAPGGWTQVAVKKGAQLVVGIDLLEMEPVDGAHILVGDFLDAAKEQELCALLGGPPDLVMSDMAANTVGHKQTDHLRTAVLSEAAARFAMANLATGGAFVTKMFQGGTENQMLALLKQCFKEVHHAKPPSSRAGSVELFMVAKGFRGVVAPKDPI
jgi:23S rRNA (uridine2552-2'-O)-methyltransferase